MNRQPVESSTLHSVGYDPVESILELEFHDGRLYQYSAVPEEIYRELMAADSKGRYFLTYIQDQYPYARTGDSTQA
ncbi:MAG TPA: KTSC domain-containing protein [Thermomicrobiales bacterium]|nr:KTSC domain-containing protein [Thermomicrobiales bacterium]